MNEETTALAPRERIHDLASPALDASRFDQMQRIAKAIARSTLVPEHLKVRPYWWPKKGGMAPAEIKRIRAELGDEEYSQSIRNAELQTTANVFRVVNHAVRWNLDPFAVVDSTYVVHGKLGWEGKLVCAIVNDRAGLAGRLSYEFSGAGDDRTVTVSGRFKSESQARTVELSVRQAKTDNQMWQTDPDQKLVYSGATKWARRHCPEILLGVLTDDDLERVVVMAQVERGVFNALPQLKAADLVGLEPDAPVEENAPEAAEEQSEKPGPHDDLGDTMREMGIKQAVFNAALFEAGLIERGETWRDLAPEIPTEWVQKILSDVFDSETKGGDK